MNALRTHWSALIVASLLTACGGDKKDAETPTASHVASDEEIDKDPVALVSSDAISATRIDAHALFSNATFGADVAILGDRFLPVDLRGVVVPQRDVDRAIIVTYSVSGANTVSVLSGRFDKVKTLAALRKTAIPVAQATNAPQGALVESSYAGKPLFSKGTVTFMVVTDKTALVGDDAGVRRVLDRIQEGNLKRSLAPWVIETIETKDTLAAAAFDLTQNPLSSAGSREVPLPFVKGMQTGRAFAKVQSPMVEFTGNLTYGTEADAKNGADKLGSIVNLANIASMTGTIPRLENVQITPSKNGVDVRLQVSEQGIRGLAQALPSLINLPK